jgi:hypothetical protein
VAKLSKLGKDGNAAAALAAATAPGRPPGTSRASRTAGANGSSPENGVASLPNGHRGSSLGAILDALTGSDGGGLGAVLPIAMVAAVLVFASGLRAKRRSAGVSGQSGEAA